MTRPKPNCSPVRAVTSATAVFVLQDPPALAAWALQSKPEWTEERIRAAMNGEKSVQ